MAAVRVGVIGGGWPGIAHVRGYRTAGGFQVAAVADLIPQRRDALLAEAGGEAAKVIAYASAEDLLKDPSLSAVSICLPTHLHLETAALALRRGKHVMLETPPAPTLRDTRKLASAGGRAAEKTKAVLACAFQRRFGGAELASRQVIERGYLGDVQHVRASWMRTRGIPVGTGWYADASRSGGGALIDLGLPMLDLAWYLLGEPMPVSVHALARSQFVPSPGEGAPAPEDFATALLAFDGGKTLELSCAWAVNQPPAQNGTACRVYGSSGALEVYGPQGPVLYRHFNAKGESKATPLKQPKVTGHAAMLRQFKEAIAGGPAAGVGADQAVVLMRIIEALYKSIATGKSVTVSNAAKPSDEDSQTAQSAEVDDHPAMSS